MFGDVIYVAGFDSSRVFGINNAGDVVGAYRLNGHAHGSLMR